MMAGGHRDAQLAARVLSVAVVGAVLSYAVLTYLRLRAAVRTNARPSREGHAAPVPRQGQRIRVLVISLGGERKQRMAQVLSGCDDFEVGFSEGVSARELRTRDGLLKAFVDTGLIDGTSLDPGHFVRVAEQLPRARGDSEGKRADDDPSDSSASTISTAERTWLSCRHLSRERAVLACCLAHLRAMRRAVDEGWDVILEDNCRGPVSSGEAARRIRACAMASPDADLRYYSYSGRAEEVASWLLHLSGSGSEGGAALPWPRMRLPSSAKPDAGCKAEATAAPTAGAVQNVLFGCLCYAIGQRAEGVLRGSLRADMPGSLVWSPRRQKVQHAKPVDKLLPNRLHAAGCRIAVAREPAFVRAPVSSLIHVELDRRFLLTSLYAAANLALSRPSDHVYARSRTPCVPP